MLNYNYSSGCETIKCDILSYSLLFATAKIMLKSLVIGTIQTKPFNF